MLGTVLLSGCASSGREDLSTGLDNIRPRMNSTAVVQTLGEPGEKFQSGGQSEVWIYRDQAFSQRKNAMVPVEYLIYLDGDQVTSYDYVTSDL